LTNGILRWKGKIYVGATGHWRQDVLQLCHDSAQEGHYGVAVTHHRLRQLFHWPNMKDIVINYVKTCPTCQMTKKNENIHTPDLLQNYTNSN
jgi:Integrase zinc binding domain